MKRIMIFALCFGLAAVGGVEAKPKDKDARKRQHAERKIAHEQAKLQRQSNRGRLRERGDLQPLRNLVRQGRTEVRRRGPANYAWSYDEARQHHRRGVRRDRAWYRNNFNRFALFAGGYYYWDRGYWYPAYGYDQRYSTYAYDEPIYGYNSLDPRDVIVNVQRALRRQGYYRGSIDGLIGPMTRTALERYQRDRGLYVTRAIDGPTLAALGLT